MEMVAPGLAHPVAALEVPLEAPKAKVTRAELGAAPGAKAAVAVASLVAATAASSVAAGGA